MWIDDYLARLGDRGAREPTAAVLARLHVAHLIAVPFENLSIHRGERIQLDPDWLRDKIIARRRGGFCYELNGLFAELLTALGFGVDRLAARVYDDDTLGIPFDHLALRVRTSDETTWLADVGFGDSFVRPLRCDDADPQPDGRRTFRIVPDGADAAILVDAGRRAFRFELRAYALGDFAGGCAYHQTSAASPFTRRRVVSRLTADGRITLRDDRLITTDASGAKTEAPVVGERAYHELLATQFGIAL